MMFEREVNEMFDLFAKHFKVGDKVVINGDRRAWEIRAVLSEDRVVVVRRWNMDGAPWDFDIWTAGDLLVWGPTQIRRV